MRGLFDRLLEAYVHAVEWLVRLRGGWSRAISWCVA